jgi:hypothetical protein
VYSGATGAVIGYDSGEPTPSGFGVVRNAGDFNGDGLADGIVIAGAAGSTPRVRVVSGAGVPAGSMAFGTGCPDPAGRIPGLGAYGGTPDVVNGNPAFGLVVSNLAPGAAPSIVFGYSTTSWGTTPLPFDLGALGLQGCTLRTSVDVLVGLSANLAQPAAAGLSLPVPVAPALVGSAVTVQAYVPTTSTGLLPGVLSRAITLVAR